MPFVKHFSNSHIPLWINIMQIILILIMLGQVYVYFFNHQLLADAGIIVDSVPMMNFVYEMGARLGVIAFASIFVLFTQDVKQYLVILFMNIIREGQETIIDPLYHVLNAPASPIVDLGIHILIVTLEVFAFIAVYKIYKNKQTS